MWSTLSLPGAAVADIALAVVAAVVDFWLDLLESL
jgi:hypothetical protein